MDLKKGIEDMLFGLMVLGFISLVAALLIVPLVLIASVSVWFAFLLIPFILLICWFAGRAARE